jgi:hypothetical protein
MAVEISVIKAVSADATRPLAELVEKAVQAPPERVPGAVTTKVSVAGALALKSESQATSRLSRLFEMIGLAGAAERVAHLNSILGTLRQELPEVLAKLPLRLSHFGFTGARALEDFVQFIGKILADMQTRATSLEEFEGGIAGWRWNLGGRLFERLVKFDRKLDIFFRKLAGDLLRLVNDEKQGSRATLVDIFGKPRRVDRTFGKPLKVVEFSLVGADGVKRPFTDFGFIAQNAQGRWVLLPIEIKLPAALSKVAGQFSEFLPRLREAQKLFALVADEQGEQQKIPIDPTELVLMQHDAAQVAVAPLSTKAMQSVLDSTGGSTSARSIHPDDVAAIVEFKPRTSQTHGLAYYQVRLLVARDWLESIVRLLTDPPKG